MSHITILSQTYPPDPAAVGQYIADAAEALATRGHTVTVYTSARGYDDPSVRYASFEVRGGVSVHRLSMGSFGKQTFVHRIVGLLSYSVQAGMRAWTGPKADTVLFSTSPPLIGVVACVVGALKRSGLVYWVMDLNPDQLIALGKIRENSLVASVLRFLNTSILRGSDAVVALDRFMAERLTCDPEKIATIPPWPLESTEEMLPSQSTQLRAQYQLTGKFVVMYSGNHSPSNPLDTLLHAALALRNREDIVFMFVGGGVGKISVEQFVRDHALTNVLSLPYQPQETLNDSLSTADVHVVSLGESMVGIIHPCKVYGAMAVGRPILYFGPNASHVTDILDEHAVGFHVVHGDTESAVTAITSLAEMAMADRDRLGDTARKVIDNQLSTITLRDRFCDVVESVAK